MIAGERSLIPQSWVREVVSAYFEHGVPQWHKALDETAEKYYGKAMNTNEAAKSQPKPSVPGGRMNYAECMTMIDEILDIYGNGYPLGGGDEPLWYYRASTGDVPVDLIEANYYSIQEDLTKMREWQAAQ